MRREGFLWWDPLLGHKKIWILFLSLPQTFEWPWVCHFISQCVNLPPIWETPLIHGGKGVSADAADVQRRCNADGTLENLAEG